MTKEIVDFPIKNGRLVYQRVSSIARGETKVFFNKLLELGMVVTFGFTLITPF
jgi:hypothetical protein